MQKQNAPRLAARLTQDIHEYAQSLFDLDLGRDVKYITRADLRTVLKNVLRRKNCDNLTKMDGTIGNF